MKKVSIIFLFLIIILIVFGMLIKDKVPNNIFCFLDIGTYKIPPKSVEVNSSNVYGQSFASNFDNLFMMSIFIPVQNLDGEGELYFHLKNNKDDKVDLAVLKWRLDEIRFKENNFYIIPPDREVTEKGFHFHFQFPVIRGSKNKEFYFYFESPKTKAGEGIKLGVWDSIQYYESLTKGNVFINHKPAKGFLAFRTYNTWQGSTSVLINGIKDRLIKDKLFLVFYLASLFLILFGIAATYYKLRTYER